MLTTRKILVMMEDIVPQELIDHAQVVIISDDSRHIIGPDPWRMAIWDKETILPPMACDRIDVRGCKDEDIERIVKKYITLKQGVTNLDELKEAMTKIGAKIL